MSDNSQSSEGQQAFTLTPHLGWTCHCGANEKTSALTSDLRVVHTPLVVRFHWHGSVKVTLLQCLLCGCGAQVNTTHSIIDMEINKDGIAVAKNG